MFKKKKIDFHWLNYIYQKQYIIEWYLLNKEKILQSKGADDT